MKPNLKYELLGLVMRAESRSREAGALAMLVVNSTENWSIEVGRFPLKIVGGGQLELNSPSLDSLESAGVVERTDHAVCLRPEAAICFLMEEKGTSTTSSSNCSKKNTTSTRFVFQAGHPSGKELAFADFFKLSDRRGMVLQVSSIGFEMAQQIVHEVGGVVLGGKKINRPISYTGGIARKAKSGDFFPAEGLELEEQLESFLENSSRPVQEGTSKLRRVK